MGVSRSGFYAWRRRPKSKRESENEKLLELIKSIFEESRQTYGSPRVHRALLEQGIICNRKRVERLMRVNGIKAKFSVKFKPTSTDSSHSYPIAENLLNRDFSAQKPNQKWTGDIKYIRTKEGWLYLAVVLDLFNREVIGWATSDRITQELTQTAMLMALGLATPEEGFLFHSDRGSQYAAINYRAILEERGITCSMSRRANCWDNSVTESFFATLVKDLLVDRDFITRKQASFAVVEYITCFYNSKRIHTTLGHTNPKEFKRRFIENSDTGTYKKAG